MSTSMRGLLCDSGGDDMGYHWIRLIESFQMSTSMRGLLCEWVIMLVPLDLFAFK